MRHFPDAPGDRHDGGFPPIFADGYPDPRAEDLMDPWRDETSAEALLN